MRILDCCCGAGGAGKGYEDAGFEVVGIDIEAQPNYCGSEFEQRDVIEYLRELVRLKRWLGEVPGLDAIHASVPCQAYTPVTKWRGDQADHVRLIEPVRELLEEIELPWVMENSPWAPLRADVKLCGTALGLRVQRHRIFELSWEHEEVVPRCAHRPDDYAFDHGGKQPESVYRAAMHCDWMTVRESRQAIPPAYTEWIGNALIAWLNSPTIDPDVERERLNV
jgi:hypothetical protein